ncbi:MAG TPA: hypothetical protein VGQ42_16295 [Candidatus Dormibacteraeota bacterium]|nr:hypothetical protein [Candidatus Dormibacteraeota bacterium]
MASERPAKRPGGAGPTALQPKPTRTPRFPKLPRLSRPTQAQDTPALSDAELEAVVAPLLAEVQSLRAEVEQLRGPLPDLTTPAARNRNLMLLALGVLVGFALIVIALAVVLKA